MKVYVNIRIEKEAKRQDFCASPRMCEGCPVHRLLCASLVGLVCIKEARWARVEHCVGVAQSWQTNVFFSYL